MAGSGFFATAPKSQATKEKVQDIIKILKIFAANETSKKVKRQLIEWKKMFVNHVSNRDLYLNYINNFCNSIIKI